MPRRDGYQLQPTAAFLGLNLRQQPMTGALDLLNVTFPDVGGVLNRWGYDRFGSVNHGAAVRSLGTMWSASGARRLLVSTDTALRALDQSGLVTHTAAGGALPTAAMTSYARVGLPGSERVYMANGKDTVRRYDLATGFTAPVCTVLNAVTGVPSTGQPMPKPLCVANWAAENRVVYAGFDLSSGAPGGTLVANHDIVWISDPPVAPAVAANLGPEQFRDDSYIYFSPGDGSRTMAAVSWRDQVFIFKEDKHLVLTGVSVSGGVPTFLKRAVHSGVGPVGPMAAAAGPLGVYFCGRKGLYVTTGAESALLTRDLDALWGEAPVPPFYTGGRINPARLDQVRVAAGGNYVYMSFPAEGSATNNRLLVYHVLQGWFSLYNLPAACMAVFRQSTIDEMHFGHPAVNVIMRHGENVIGDDGQPYRSFWLGGFEEMAAGRVVRVRQIAVYGSGVIDVGLAIDFESLGETYRLDLSAGSDRWGDGTGPDLWGDGTDPNDTWGVGNQITGKLARHSYRAAHCALYLGDNPNDIAHQQQWFVHRAIKHVAGGRAVSVLTGTGS